MREFSYMYAYIHVYALSITYRFRQCKNKIVTLGLISYMYGCADIFTELGCSRRVGGRWGQGGGTTMYRS